MNRSTSPSIVDNAQRRKFMQLIAFLDNQNQRLQEELAGEKRRRSEELAAIIESLLIFETKLSLEKKTINKQLLAKDKEICRLVSINKALKSTHSSGESNYENIAECELVEALKCMKCKKEFYEIESKDECVQTGRNVSYGNNTEIGSSSDDTFSSSFCAARQSVRYTSKRTIGTFRDYMRSRSMNIDDQCNDNSEENASTISRDESQNSYEKVNMFSRTIDRMHGIRRVSSFEGDLDSETDSVHREKKPKNRNHSMRVETSGAISSTIHNNHNDTLLPVDKYDQGDFSGTSPQHTFETSMDDWYASASEPEDGESVNLKAYKHSAINPVLECVNQILLQQSMDECPNENTDFSVGIEGNGECDEFGKESVSNTGTGSRKRVHFSTKNSMVHVPRDQESSEATGITSSVIAKHIKDNISNYESIYSNEYEPIGSEQNSSNLYVDMESKLGHEEKLLEKVKTPPALPPKPANLMKFKRVVKITPVQQEGNRHYQSTSNLSEPDYCSISEVNIAVRKVQTVADVHKDPSEGELNGRDENSTCVSPTAILKSDEIEEIFADIPKLPNVAAIIAPKTPVKQLPSHSSTSNETRKKIPMRQIKRKHVPNILVEINKRMNGNSVILSNQMKNGLSPMKLPLTNSNSLQHIPKNLFGSQVLDDEELPLQAEFDWYNLDAEYGKSFNQPDIVKAADNMTYLHEICESGSKVSNMENVEYNLDEEFSLNHQPDIIKENSIDPKNPNSETEVQTPPLSESATICKSFPTIADSTPICAKASSGNSFGEFLENSGLSAKPLPRQRKIYFSGPFV